MRTFRRLSPERVYHARLYTWFFGSLLATCSLLLGGPAFADCDGLTPANFERIRNKTEPAYQLQATIRTAYDIDDSMLSDGYIGRQTLREIRRFCTDLNLVAENNQDLTNKLIEALNAFKSLADERTDPGWRRTLETQEFKAWAETQPSGTYGEFFNYTSEARLIPGGIFMLALYDAHQQAIPPPAPEPKEEEQADPVKPPSFSEPEEPLQADPGTPLTGLFVLNDADFETMKSKAKAVQNLDGLIGSSGADRYELLKEVARRLELDPQQPHEFLEPLLTAAKKTSKLAGTTGARDDGDSSTNKDERSSKKKKGNRKEDDQKKEVADNEKDNTPKVYEITEATLKDTGVQAWKKSFTRLEPALEELIVLKDIRFPDGVLFRTAVRLTGSFGLDKDDVATINVILRAARKPPTWAGEDSARRAPTDKELALAPIKWKGAGCGCGMFESLDPNYPTFLYGIYPYWQAPQAGNRSNESDPQVIDFSLLNRVGYYGVTFNSDARIVQPLHFKQKETPQDGWFWQRRNFAQFVRKAHQYKTKVDLVVFNSEWDSLAAPGVDRGEAQTRLIEGITKILTEELDGPVNDVKPLMSAGISPARTLGDGVTFHFDFRAVGLEGQETLSREMLDKKFFEALKVSLLQADGSVKMGVNYFTNMIIPGECMAVAAPDEVPGCNFYRLENLEKIADSIDLFLIDFSSATRGDDLLATLEVLLNYVGSIDESGNKNAKKQKGLLREKIIPLANLPPGTEDPLALQESLEYADWYFSGFGTWNTDHDDKARQALRDVFTREGEDSVLRNLGASVCNFACPQRWWIRAFMALAALVGIVYAFASYWVFRLRDLYAHRGFLVFVLLIVVVLIVTFLCDPYWARKQSAVLLVAFTGFFATWAVWRWRKEQQHRYP